MPTTDRHSQRLVIAGASSLIGQELKSLLEESRFAGWDLRLVDEEDVAGTLTEAGGEPAVIQKIEEDTFQGARFAFLAGSRAFGKRCLGPAQAAGAVAIDFTHATLSDPDASPWFPQIEALTGKTILRASKAFSVFSAGGAAVSSLALLLRRFGLQRLTAVLLESVSEVGRVGIEELETQTSQLLSFQTIGSPVFGTQSAFNLLPRYAAESRYDLQVKLLELRAEISAAMADPSEDAEISVNLLHAPVFYGATFNVCADLGEETDTEALAEACRAAGFLLVPASDPAPSNTSVAGETSLYLAQPRADSSRANSWWFWGAGDNLRAPAWNAIKLAEWLDT